MKNKEIENVSFSRVKRQLIPFDICPIENLYQRFDGTLVNLFQPHRIQFHGLTIITKGKGKHFVDFEERTFLPGTILPSLKGQVHSFEKDLKVEGVIISFDESFITSGLSESDLFHFLQLFYTPYLQIGEENLPHLVSFVDTLYEIQESLKANLKPELIRSVFFSLIFQIKRHSIYQHKTFQSKRYKDFINFKELVSNHYFEIHNANDYANKMKVSYKYLNDICKEMANRTAKSFIDSWLILEIKRQLSEDKYTSQEIAFNVGFQDPSNFIRFFKKHAATTPKKFLSQLKNQLG